jgi:hypothetical protein
MSEEHGAPKTFQLEEATIADLHRAIRAGETTLGALVQRYIDRARAYSGPEFGKTEAGNRKRSERPQVNILIILNNNIKQLPKIIGDNTTIATSGIINAKS